MLKQVVTYTDFNGKEKSRDLYFHISEARILDNMALIENFKTLTADLDGPERELTTEEKQKIFNLVKAFMQLSYGVRSEDGETFRQRDELWEEFVDSACYNAFILSLFLEPSKGMEFVMGVMPADYRSNVVEEFKKRDVYDLAATTYAGLVADGVADDTEAVQQGTTTHLPPENGVIDEVDTRPTWMKEDRDPTDAELRAMSRDEMVLAMQRRMRQS